MARVNVAAIGRLQQRLEKLADPDPTPLMLDWQQILIDDNRRGVLAGLDCNDVPMERVTYRPAANAPKGRVTARMRNGAPRGKGLGVSAGFGPAAAGLNNNLTPAEYRTLSGPPLAPRRESSRVITNLVTGHGIDAETDNWYAEAWWEEVVSVRGVLFLPAHFTGANVGRGRMVKLPIRNLRGVRQWGRRKALRALQQWGWALVKGI